MGSEGIGDQLWETLFATGPLVENPAITTSITRSANLNVLLEAADQLGTARPASAQGDVGAIEIP